MQKADILDFEDLGCQKQKKKKAITCHVPDNPPFLAKSCLPASNSQGLRT
jgi:hypothetical protein